MLRELQRVKWSVVGIVGYFSGVSGVASAQAVQHQLVHVGALSVHDGDVLGVPEPNTLAPLGLRFEGLRLAQGKKTQVRGQVP